MVGGVSHHGQLVVDAEFQGGEHGPDQLAKRLGTLLGMLLEMRFDQLSFRVHRRA